MIRQAEDADADAVAALVVEFDDARVYSATAWLHTRRTSPPEALLLQLVATAGAAVVATGAAGRDLWTAPENGWCTVGVTAEARRRGIGSDLLERLLEHLRAAGVRKASSLLRHTVEGERWASARGFSRALSAPLIAVDPRTVGAPALPDGFRCAPMAAVGPERVYEVVVDAARDEPRADPIVDIPYDDFLRDWDAPQVDLEASGVICHGDAAVAFSFLEIAGDRGQHGFTGTRSDYRGRGLATAVKRYALRAAAARGVTRVTTSNAEQNAPMRAVNRRLGFEQIGEHVILSRTL
jgi:GNAT superfamily N-acetyltransferase